MNPIHKERTLPATPAKAFKLFTEHFHDWWPHEYTWSQNKLEKITIAPKVGGLCTEIGPNGFRCDFGQVTQLEMDSLIAFKWQIGPHREPVPDPEKASKVVVSLSR